MMKRYLLVLGVLALLVTGCPGVYSKQEFGPTILTGTTLQELIEKNGCPDLVGGHEQMMIVGWYRTEGTHILVFSHMKKTAMGALIDSQGRVVARGSGQPGKGITILGLSMGPVVPVETK